MNKFKLSHVVLYAKGWYCKTDNVWEDLKHILKLDNYEPYTNNDVLMIILRHYQNWKGENLRLIDFICDIHPQNCWKTGFYTKDDWDKKSTQEYSMELACIYKILSDLRFIDSNEGWIKKVPKWSKEYPRPKNIELKRTIEIFNTK